MKLRVRLALTTVAVAIPVALCMGWIHLAIETRAVETALSEYEIGLIDEATQPVQVITSGDEGNRNFCSQTNWILDIQISFVSRNRPILVIPSV